LSLSAASLALKERAREAAERLKEGAELSQALQGGFPQVLVRLVHTGQQSGTLPQVLQEAADTYEQEATRRLQRAVALLEPTLILLMGSVVTFVVLGVLLPIFELNQLIR
jgi:general secretion pathway protein F